MIIKFNCQSTHAISPKWDRRYRSCPICNTTLRTLDVDLNLITDIGAQALKENKSLTTISLRFNKITNVAGDDQQSAPKLGQPCRIYHAHLVTKENSESLHMSTKWQHCIYKLGYADRTTRIQTLGFSFI